jgi:hypothetical protein
MPHDLSKRGKRGQPMSNDNRDDPVREQIARSYRFRPDDPPEVRKRIIDHLAREQSGSFRADLEQKAND